MVRIYFFSSSSSESLYCDTRPETQRAALLEGFSSLVCLCELEPAVYGPYCDWRVRVEVL